VFTLRSKPNIESGTAALTVYDQIVQCIIQKQESIVGPLAVQTAKNVEGLIVISSNNIKISAEPKSTIDRLVMAYSDLFGQISVDVCNDAAYPMVSGLDMLARPSTLKGSS
jgi:hypothetical protein